MVSTVHLQLSEQGRLEVCSSRACLAVASALTFAGTPIPLGLPARRHACCGKRSDQLPQGASGLPDAPGHPSPAVVDAAGGDPLDPERSGLAGGCPASTLLAGGLHQQGVTRNGCHLVTLGFLAQASIKAMGESQGRGSCEPPQRPWPE